MNLVILFLFGQALSGKYLISVENDSNASLEDDQYAYYISVENDSNTSLEDDQYASWEDDQYTSWEDDDEYTSWEEGAGWEAMRGNCSFDKDCDVIMDGPTQVCRFGKCYISRKKVRECERPVDCRGMQKCTGKNCVCENGSCEWHCDTTKDCFNQKPYRLDCDGGFQTQTCKCENHLCKYVDKPKECDSWRDCQRRGVCDRDMCKCVMREVLGGFCTVPWFLQYGHSDNRPGVQCHGDMDCERYNIHCQETGEKCKCLKEKRMAKSRDGICV